MAETEPGHDDVARLRRATERVLKDPAFVRSPGLSKLLRYLVDMTIAGHADTLKSITVATEGLGRSSSDAPEAQARVQIARLRSALQAHYASGAGHEDPDRLVLSPGTYRIVLGAPHDAQPLPDAAELPMPAPEGDFRRLAPGKTRIALAVLLSAVAAIALLIGQEWRSRDEAARWQRNDFPSLTVVTDRKSPAISEDTPARLEQLVLIKLAPYEGLRLVQGKSTPPEFALNISVRQSEVDFREDVRLIDKRSGRVIWASELRTPDLGNESLSLLADKVGFEIGNATGALHTYNRRQSVDVDGPYACWLRFTGLIETASTIGDDRLYDCASSWYKYASQKPTAAMLRGWTLTDRSLVQLSDARRDTLLEDALSVLYDARVLNPRSLGLQLADMRAHGFAGNYAEMKEAGTAAIALNPGSPQVKAMVGTNLALWNDPEGAHLIRQALAMHPSAPAWYHIGLVVDAMMRDDRHAENLEIQELHPIRERTPLVAILFAAHAAQERNAKQARLFLDRPPFRTIFGGIDVARVLNRLPVAPVVRQRLKKMLEPALRK